jgi:hypothetical protein
LERFLGRQNIEHYKELLKTVTDPVRRGMIEKLLREEEQKLKLAEKKPEKK